ncbi:hypothetical protein [Sinobacterium caligoides]|nr:hypothetical protein [Sinobacterium caligoides]
MDSGVITAVRFEADDNRYYCHRYIPESDDDGPCDDGFAWDQSLEQCDAPDDCLTNFSTGCMDDQPTDACENSNDILTNPDCAAQKDSCEAAGGAFGFFNGGTACLDGVPANGGCGANSAVIASGDGSTDCAPLPAAPATGAEGEPLGGTYDEAGEGSPTDLDGNYVCPDGSRPNSANQCPVSDEICYGANCPVPKICDDGYPSRYGSSGLTCDRPTPSQFCDNNVPVWDLASCPEPEQYDPELPPDHPSQPGNNPSDQPPPAVVENPVQTDSQGAEVATGACNPQSKTYLQCIAGNKKLRVPDRGQFEDLTQQMADAQSEYEDKFNEVKDDLYDRLSLSVNGGGSVASNVSKIRGVDVDFSIARHMSLLSIVGNVFLACASLSAAFIVLSAKN